MTKLFHRRKQLLRQRNLEFLAFKLLSLYSYKENDFAFGSVGVTILQVKKRMIEEIESVVEKSYPEQSILSSLTCLRILGKRFPQVLSVHFRKKDFEKSKAAFYEWYERSHSKISKKYRTALLESAESEFELFQKDIFGKT